MARTSSPRSQKLQTAQVLHLGSKFSPCCHPSCPLASPECFNNISLHAQIWRLPIFMHTSWLMEAWCRCWFQTWSIYFVVDASLFRFRVAIQYGFQVVGAKSMFKIRCKRHWSLPNAVTSALPTGHSTFQLRPSRLHPSVHSWCRLNIWRRIQSAGNWDHWDQGLALLLHFFGHCSLVMIPQVRGLKAKTWSELSGSDGKYR